MTVAATALLFVFGLLLRIWLRDSFENSRLPYQPERRRPPGVAAKDLTKYNPKRRKDDKK